ncbi:hypothetical protein P171DRAFT_480964 [Karstenula rhodostoma CBS 690.94]|uniref:Uncharacterized protein n=1 Tax=Karstenula rhodostoma CBS 690.94 TaxID=1392251 RepID=A0A9P4PV65_9PLEO|nr:hypothetical protein P171DRAFT_480964 [Karstenula rhodostoma CBS 690.94]
MSEHPLPALPREDQYEVQLEPRLETHYQTRCERTSILKESGETYALFDDTSEIDIRPYSYPDDAHHGLSTFLHASTLPDDLPSQKPSGSVEHDAQTYCSSAADSQRTQRDYIERGASRAPEKLDNSLWSTSNDTALPSTPCRASCDAVCDYVPDATSVQQCIYCPSDANFDPRCDAPMESDDELFRETLVRFADAHTILCTPPPPTPPPHLTFSSASSLPSAPPRLTPYGPRIPPWGSTENLDRERRLRTDIRTFEDTLDEQFDDRERLRKEAEARNEKRRTEGEELRELVLGIYPEMEAGQKERGCCLCAVM